MYFSQYISKLKVNREIYHCLYFFNSTKVLGIRVKVWQNDHPDVHPEEAHSDVHPEAVHYNVH